MDYSEQDNGASGYLQFWQNSDVCDNNIFFTASSNCDDASMLLKQAVLA